MHQSVSEIATNLVRRNWRIKKLVRRLPGIHRMSAYFHLIAPSKSPKVQFIIFGQGRSGGTLLADLLNSSSEVCCDKEILSYKMPFPELYVKACGVKSKKPIYGFKVKISQIITQKALEPRQFMTDLHEKGWKIIYLRRTNVLRQAVSNLVAAHRKSIHHKLSDGPLKLDKIHVDCKDLIRRMKVREELLQNEEKVLEGLPYITVTYEEDLLRPEDHQRTLDKLFDYLSTPRVPVSTQLARTSKDDLSDMLDNYEELLQTLAKTKYAGLLSADQSVNTVFEAPK